MRPGTTDEANIADLANMARKEKPQRKAARAAGELSLERMASRLRPNNLHRELLVRAAKIRGAGGEPLTAIDATAGLGEDALLLAAAGFRLVLFERDPAIAALLGDALREAAASPDVRVAEAVGRMRMIEGDAIEGLGQLDRVAGLEEPPAVVYLDPMFPARRKSAATNKKMQLFRSLENPCTEEDAEALLAAAIAAGPRKVVVKRPLKGPYLAGVRPSYSLAGKVVRYDVIVPAQAGNVARA